MCMPRYELNKNESMCDRLLNSDALVMTDLV